MVPTEQGAYKSYCAISPFDQELSGLDARAHMHVVAHMHACLRVSEEQERGKKAVYYVITSMQRAFLKGKRKTL